MTNILHCRSLESNNYEKNNEWETQLKEPIILNPNDQLFIRNSFIDTRNISSSALNFDTQLQFNITFGYWLHYHSINTLDVIDYTQSNPPNMNNYGGVYYSQPNGRKYLIYEKIAGVDSFYITGISYEYNGLDPTGTFRYGQFYVLFDYDVNSVLTTGKVWLPNTPYRARKINVAPCNIKSDLGTIRNIRYQDKYGNPTNTDTWNTRGIGLQNFQGHTVLGVDQVAPLTNTVELIIPVGIYEPDELVNLINKQLETTIEVWDNDGNITSGSFGNQILTNITQLINIPNTNPQQQRQLYIYDPDGDGTMIALKQSIYDIWVGTNQFNFDYDNNLNRFILSQCHMPIYDANGNISKKVVQSQAFTNINGNILYPQKFHFVGQNGGIVLIDMGDNQFWTDILGFNLDDIITPFNTSYVVQSTNEFMQEFINWTIITNTNKNIISTYNFIGFDDKIVKNNTFNSVNNLLNTDIVGNNLISIPAQNPYQSSFQPTSYFLIECDFGLINNNFIGQSEINKKIKGIISKYYTVDSYTTGGQEVDVSFINNNQEPIIIVSCKFRILNPDLSDAQIGDDNSVVLQHVYA